MSEQTSKVFVTPHNQACAKGDVLKLGYNGKSGYWRVIGFEDNKPYAKLLFLGYHSGNRPLQRNRYGEYREFYDNFNYNSPRDGKPYTTKVAYYNSEYSESQYKSGLDQLCKDFISNFVTTDRDLYYATRIMSMPAQKVYYVPSLHPASMVVNPDIVVNRNISNYTYCVKQVGTTDQTWTYGRRCRCLSMDDIVEYFDSTELTARDIADNLLGGKHGLDATNWSVVTEGFLYDGAVPLIDTDWGCGSFVSYYNTDRQNEYYGSYINWDPLNIGSAATDNTPIPVIELNLHTYRFWELAQDW